MKLLKLYGLLLISTLFAVAYANAQTGSVKVGSITGKVTVINASTGTSTEAAADAVFTAPATIVTDGDSSILLFLSNGAVLEVKPGSRVEINHFDQEAFEPGSGDPFQSLSAEPSTSQVSIRVVSGQVAAKVPSLSPTSTFLVTTPTSDVDIKDTVVVVDYNAETASTNVSNVGGGSVVYESNTGGDQTSVPPGGALDVPGQVDPSTGTPSAGTPVAGEAQPAATNASQTVSNPPASSSSTPSTPPPAAAPIVTPTQDVPDLVNPTSTEPN